MTRDEIMAMSAEELRVKIALKLRWTYIEQYKSGFWCGTSPDGKLYQPVPDYPHNISAAWELEGAIPFGDRPRYIGHLVDVLNALPEPRRQWEVEWLLAHSTPEEKSRAWLMWKEGV